MHFIYSSFLLISLIGLIFLDKKYNMVLFHKEYKQWLISIIVTVIVFLGIDLLGVLSHVFWTNPNYVLGIWILPGVPLEEVLFLILVSYFTLLLGKWRNIL